MDVDTPSGIGIQSDQYGMEIFKRVLSGSLQYYIYISNSKLFPKFIGQKTKKKSMFGGNKNILSLCMYPQSSQMKYDSSRFPWMSNIIFEENCVYVFTLASHPIPPLLHTLLHPSCLCARERANVSLSLQTKLTVKNSCFDTDMIRLQKIPSSRILCQF